MLLRRHNKGKLTKQDDLNPVSDKAEKKVVQSEAKSEVSKSESTKSKKPASKKAGE